MIMSYPEIERQGVVRFRHGMRNEKGKKDSDLSDHLNYHLMEDTELTWKNAIEVTSRWEMAKNRRKKSKKAESSSNSSDSSDDEVESVEVKKKSSKSKKNKEEEGKAEKDDNLKYFAAVADQVHENQMKIKGLETGQTRLETGQTQLIAAQTTAATALSNLQAKLDGLVQHQTYTPAFAQQNYQQPVRRFQAPLQGNQLGQCPVPAAAIKTGEVQAEGLGAYEGDRRVSIGLANLQSLADLAGVELDEEHLASGVEKMNFY